MEAQQKQEAIKQLLALSNAASQRELTAEEIATLNAFTDHSSTLDRALGVQYATVGPEGISLRVTIDERHLQPWGVTNGGVYCSLGETAGSMASFIAAGARANVMGTSNETHFLRPSVAGDTIVSTARPEHLGRTSHLWRIEHRNEATGKLCALTVLKTTVIAER